MAQEYDNKKPKLPSIAVPLGKAVKALRGRKRLTQAQLADRVGNRISQGYISRVEKGLCFPRGTRLNTIVEALDCTHQELWAAAEALAGMNLSDNDILRCLSHNSLDGCSFEELRALYAEQKHLKEIDAFNRMLSKGKINKSQLSKIDDLRERATSLPENTVILRDFIDRVLELLETACTNHALVENGAVG